MVCGCCVHKLKGELFKPHRERGCTDVVCLLLLIVAVGGLVVITYVAISAHPSLVDDLLYPTDSYGNNCGKLGTATSELSKVLYPDLDSDIVTHAGLIATGQYLTFFTSVTRLCAHACPAGVSLRGPSIYGGSDYPGGANATVPEHTYAFMTQDVFGRCFPLTSAFSEATSQLCAQPACTDQALNATLGGTVRCAALSDRPEETTTWELCAAGTAACGRRRLGRATTCCTGLSPWVSPGRGVHSECAAEPINGRLRCGQSESCRQQLQLDAAFKHQARRRGCALRSRPRAGTPCSARRWCSTCPKARAAAARPPPRSSRPRSSCWSARPMACSR